MSDGSKDSFVLYHYNPSTALAIVFIALFANTTMFHLWQLLRRRTWYFIPFVIGGIFETVGYLGRFISSRQTPDWKTWPYVMQSLTLLLAPAFFAASIYMVLGRIIRLTDGSAHSPIRVNWLTKIFVLGDVISFLGQSAGGGMLAKADTHNDVKWGERIIIGGLCVQLLFFGLFMIVAAIFHIRISRVPTARVGELTVPWRRFLVVLYVASVLIMVRSVFRVVEYIQGSDGYLMSKEMFIYIFDASLMFLTMIIFNIWHPSRIINSHTAAGASSDEESERSGHQVLQQWKPAHASRQTGTA
ncbi:RTA-like protein [Lasiodiplodia theobromae]|uniref:RTA-like protein n=1 Tax=Lasiodiplodia theobromae TaxID=45133 RepID=UPI0015C33A9F|nr:RTA-like protein [Lasiodiplodia theobromae]KAF4546735.1 RTA-like protein [Lasiodiplodia theobromae]